MKQDVLREMPGFNRIFIDENLTKYRSHLYREVRKERMWNNWTYDGVIYVSRKGTDPTNCPILKIQSGRDYQRIFGKPLPV